MNYDHPEFLTHPPEAVMAAYVLGQCAPTERETVEDHLIACADCRAQLAILVRAAHTAEPGEMEEPELAALLEQGQQAAWQAWQKVTSHGTAAALDHKSVSPETRSPAPSLLARLSARWATRDKRWGYLAPALAAAVIITLGIMSWLTLWPRPATERGLEALRRAYRGSRPLEARLTGGFAFSPFERTRGPSPPAGIDQDQLNLANAELARAASSRATPEARRAMGQFFLLRGEFDKADEQFSFALADAPRNAQLRADLAALYYERSQREDPAPLLLKAVEHATIAIEADPKLAEAWFNRALCYEQLALFNEAQTDWEQYLKLDSDSKWAEEAREHLKKLRERAERLSKRNELVRSDFLAAEAAGDEMVMRQLITEHFITIKDLVAEPLFDEYLNAAITGDQARAGESLKRLRRLAGLASEIKGDLYLADAVDFAARAGPAAKQALREVRALLKQADQAYDRSAYDSAFKLYSGARAIAERLGDVCHLEVALYGLTRYRYRSTQPSELTTLRNQLATDTTSRRHRQLQAKALISLANDYASSMQLSRYLELNLQAIDIAEELGDLDTAVNGLRLAGNAYARMGDYEQAVKKNFDALSLLRDNPMTPQRAAQVYVQMGEILFRMANYSAALPYQRETARMAEQVSHPMAFAGAIERLGLTYSKLGHNEEATRFFNDAVARTETVADQTVRLRLGIDLQATLGDFYLRQNKLDEAIATYQRLIQALGETGNRFYLSAIHQGIATAYLKQGRETEAGAALQTCIELAERDRAHINNERGRSAYLASRESVYHTMMDFQFITRRDPAQAFNYAEIAKGRALLDAMAGSSEVKWNDNQLYLMLSDAARPLTLEQVQQVLPADLQLVEYAVTEQCLMIWLITRDKMVPHSATISADRLRRLVSDYLDELRARRNVELLDRQATQLYELLIAPVAAHLDPRRALCIVPDGALHQLPFGALLAPTRRYLIEDFRLMRNPSASVLAQTLESARAKTPSQSGTFLGLSNPRFDRERFRSLLPLPAADNEVARAQTFYTQYRVLSRERATESALLRQMGDYKIVHLATHILANEQSPLLSSIVLADEGSRSAGDASPGNAAADGVLQAYEIAQLKLPRTRLVLLSGCRSGLGDYRRGEALGGLAQAFFTAGVPTIIASLWDVDDESTAELMSAFHEQHRTQQQDFSSAMRQAQLSLLRAADQKRRHPYYWAAFLVAGNGLAQ